MANSVNTINTSLDRPLNYDFIADFKPIVHVVRSPLLMMVHPSVPAKTVPEFIAYTKANPDRISMASGSNGSSNHMAGELFMMVTGVRMVHVPYRGESLAIADLLGGQAQIMFAPYRLGDCIGELIPPEPYFRRKPATVTAAS
jgi:tripartite-type tricarboxylate transporter receptor subunit TctC